MAALMLARDVEPIDGPTLHPHLNACPSNPQAALDGWVDNLNVLTCGSVDDGKSTLIGRLLWDTDSLYADQRATVERSPKTPLGTPDFSLLVDGLAAEHEQGITIDIAWRYLDTPARRLIIIDSPGHEQYTRNMATGASHADVAILLVDARGGVKEQTRRHAAILDLIGVRRVVLAVNKMDLVGWSERRFAEIRAEFEELTARLSFDSVAAIPVCAVLGNNVAQRSATTPWYVGPTLLEHLRRIPVRSSEPTSELRFPVQLVVRAGQDFRGLAGTVSSGRVAVGDEIVEPVSGGHARIRRIVTMGRELASASQGQAVVLELDADLDISRGAVLSRRGREPTVARNIDVRLIWLSDEPFAPARGYLLRSATDLVPVASIGVRAHLDLASLTERREGGCSANDIALATIELARPTAIDRFAEHPGTGSFVLVDAISGASVAGGVVSSAQARPTAPPRRNAFRLTRDLLVRGIGADLPPVPASESELRRRANEIAILLREAGVAVEIDNAWGKIGSDAAVVQQWLMAILSFGFVAAILLGLI